MAWGDDAGKFLARVLPWPGSQEDPGFVNLIWPFTTSDGRTGWVGSPHKTLGDLIGKAAWLITHGTPTIYYCLSLQSKTKTNAAGKVRADRSQKNALSLKTLWVDIDVKPGTSIPTKKHALAECVKFCTAAAIPLPNALVDSGGGIHCYWIMNRAMPVEEWRQLAEGLKNASIAHGFAVDNSCTTDCARILRVPETFNVKTDERRPVRLLKLAPHDYDPSQFAGLAALAGPIKVATAATGDAVAPLGGAAASPLFAGMDVEVGDEGIERAPLDFLKMVKACPFFREALGTHGARLGQPLWNLATLSATFFPNGEKLAHALASGHPEYTQESTQALYDRKVKEKADKKLGWPQCRTIQGAGATQCNTCPFLAARKSPLNLATGGPSLPQAAPATFPGHHLHLPHGYMINSDGRICMGVEKKRKRGEESDDDDKDWVPLFNNTGFSTPHGSVADESYKLNFSCMVVAGRPPVQFEVLASEMLNGQWLTKHVGLGLSPTPLGQRAGGQFMNSWLHRLQQARTVSQITRLGWVDPEGVDFMYGGNIYRPNGKILPGGYLDPKLKLPYTPIGSAAPWYDACKFITDQRRPGVENIIAVAFAAPLMKIGGKDGALLAVHGDTGGNKSTALKIGQAVWAHPKNGAENLGSTDNQVAYKLGKLGHLPFYWDEIRTLTQQAKLEDVVFQLTGGTEKGRMNRDGTMRDKGEWCTFMLTTSNMCFYDFLNTVQRTTSASFYRVLEYEQLPRVIDGEVNPNLPIYTDMEVDAKILGPLFKNYGRVGEDYARLLVDTGPKKILDRLLAARDEIGAKINIDPDKERFWSTIYTIQKVGMELANELGAEFHIAANCDFLKDVILKCRHKVQHEGYDNKASAEEALSNFLRDHRQFTIATACLPGKERRDPIIYNQPYAEQIQKGWRILVQYVDNPSVMRVSQGDFRQWMDDPRRRYGSTKVLTGLRKTYQIKLLDKHALAPGTPFTTGEARLYEFYIAPGSMLDRQREAIKSGSTYFTHRGTDAAALK